MMLENDKSSNLWLSLWLSAWNNRSEDFLSASPRFIPKWMGK